MEKNIKQKILQRIENSVLLSKELKDVLVKNINSFSEEEQEELLQKLEQEDVWLHEFLSRQIQTSEDKTRIEQLFANAKKKMYQAEEKAEQQEEDPEILLQNL